jgi:hypothetical protein
MCVVLWVCPMHIELFCWAKISLQQYVCVPIICLVSSQNSNVIWIFLLVRPLLGAHEVSCGKVLVAGQLLHIIHVDVVKQSLWTCVTKKKGNTTNLYTCNSIAYNHQIQQLYFCGIHAKTDLYNAHMNSAPLTHSNTWLPSSLFTEISLTSLMAK